MKNCGQCGEMLIPIKAIEFNAHRCPKDILEERDSLKLQLKKGADQIDGLLFAVKEAQEKQRASDLQVGALQKLLDRALDAVRDHDFGKGHKYGVLCVDIRAALGEQGLAETQKCEPECTCTIDGTPYCRAKGTGFCKAENP